MKVVKFLLFITCIISTIILSFVGFNLYVFQSSHICENEFAGSYIDKINLLQDASSPRMIFVGDSNLNHTLASELIDKAFDYNPVNMSISAAIGLRFDLESVRNKIHAGDIVIISGRFEQFTEDSSYFNSSSHPMLWGLLVMQPDAIEYITSSQQALSIISTNLNETGKRLQSSKFFEPDCIQLSPPSKLRHEFNEYGDFVGHLEQESLGKDFDKLVLPTSTLDTDITMYLNEFADYVHNQDATFLFAYPSYAEGLWLNSEDKILAFHTNINQAYDFPILGHPSTYYLPNNALYDTEDHGTADGRIQRTQQLISDLQDYFDYISID